MVTYGDWIQDADFTKVVQPYVASASSPGAVEVRNLYSTVEMIDEVGFSTSADPARINQALSDATTSAPNSSGAPTWAANTGTGARVAVDYIAPDGGYAGLPPYIEEDRASVDLKPFVFSAYNVDGWALPAQPSDAIGAEIEGYPAGTYALHAPAVGATLNGTAYHNNVDDSGSTRTQAGVTWSTTWMAGSGVFDRSDLAYYDGAVDRVGPAIFSLAGGAHGATETFSHDVTSHLTGYGELILTADMTASAITLANYVGAGHATFGTGLSAATTSITYTFRPPRYRWIYDNATTRPAYSRIVQRGSDGYGMTGGRRVVGARSIQGSLRRGTAFR